MAWMFLLTDKSVSMAMPYEALRVAIKCVYFVMLVPSLLNIFVLILQDPFLLPWDTSCRSIVFACGRTVWLFWPAFVA